MSTEVRQTIQAGQIWKSREGILYSIVGVYHQKYSRSGTIIVLQRVEPVNGVPNTICETLLDGFLGLGSMQSPAVVTSGSDTVETVVHFSPIERNYVLIK